MLGPGDCLESLLQRCLDQAGNLVDWGAQGLEFLLYEVSVSFWLLQGQPHPYPASLLECFLN